MGGFSCSEPGGFHYTLCTECRCRYLGQSRYYYSTRLLEDRCLFSCKCENPYLKNGCLCQKIRVNAVGLRKRPSCTPQVSYTWDYNSRVRARSFKQSRTLPSIEKAAAALSHSVRCVFTITEASIDEQTVHLQEKLLCFLEAHRLIK